MQKKFAAASIFVLSVLFLAGFFLYRKITMEYASAFSSSSYNILSEEIYSTILVKVDSFDSSPVKVDEITLILVDKSTQKLVKYHIPVDTQIDVPGKYGYEPFSNVYALGLLADENHEESAEILSSAIFKHFAFPIDRYLIVEDEAFSTVCGLFKGGVNIPTSEIALGELKASIRTNLSIRELFDIYSFTSSLPQDRVMDKQIGETYLENPTLLDEEFKDITFDTEFSSELKTISVLNGSDYKGVASICSRAIKNIGGRVVAVANTNEIYEKSVIIAENPNSVSVAKLKNMLGIDNVIIKSSASDYDESEILRSDITVILGVDFAEAM